MSKGVHNIAFYVSPDPECSRTTQDSEISLAPSRGRILYAIYGNSTCVINHIVVTAIDKWYRNYYVSTVQICRNSGHTPSRFAGTPAALSHLLYRFAGTPAALSHFLYIFAGTPAILCHFLYTPFPNKSSEMFGIPYSLRTL